MQQENQWRDKCEEDDDEEKYDVQCECEQAKNAAPKRNENVYGFGLRVRTTRDYFNNIYFKVVIFGSFI